jgi:RNA polymerase sigma-B factor
MAAFSSRTVPFRDEDLAGLGDRALLGIAGSLPPDSPRSAAARELLVTRYRSLVRSCVRRYLHGAESAEDLMQVGYVGLLKAISNFDPAMCGSLAAYARPCISGELKRHFRDKRWQVHVTRSVQELMLQAREATWQLAQELGRTPAESDLVRHLGATADELRHARQAELALQPCSLDAPLAGQPGMSTLADCLGAEDPRIERILGMHAVAAHWGELPPREQKILVMDFHGGMTQTEIGRRLGISQVQVCRLRGRALGYLRSRLLGPEVGLFIQGAAGGSVSAERSARRLPNARYCWTAVRSSSVPAFSPCQAASNDSCCPLSEATSVRTPSSTRQAANSAEERGASTNIASTSCQRMLWLSAALAAWGTTRVRDP